MPTNRNSSTGRDRKLVAGGQKHEVAYTARKTGTSAKQVKEAIQSVGNSRSKVEAGSGVCIPGCIFICVVVGCT
jgi:hypothetical protein